MLRCFTENLFIINLLYTRISTTLISSQVAKESKMDDIPVHVDHLSNRFIDKLRLFIRSRNLAYATEKTYVGWILRFTRYHKKKHPKDMGTPEIEALRFIPTF